MDTMIERNVASVVHRGALVNPDSDGMLLVCIHRQCLLVSILYSVTVRAQLCWCP